MRYSMRLFLAFGLAFTAETSASSSRVPVADGVAHDALGQLWFPAESLLPASKVVQVQPAMAQPLAVTVAGGKLQYVVQPRDTLIRIGSRFGVSVDVLRRDNGLDANAAVKPGQTLLIDNRHVVPDLEGDGLYVNVPQRMLFFVRNGELSAAYPVGIGKPTWPTPLGDFTVIQKAKDKTWIVPPSIQEEIRSAGKEVMTSVPPGPDNPLGRHWLGLSIPSIGIHGTISPTSVYKFQSHGCVRLHTDDIEALFDMVEVGMAGRMLYEPVLLAENDGRVYLEVHRDTYGKGGVSMQTVRQKASDLGVAERIDWDRAADVFTMAEGVARDVTLMMRDIE